MKKNFFSRLRSQKGESIAETLIALLVSTLALMILAGAISSANNIISNSESAMDAYYKENNTMLSTVSAKTGTVITVTLSDTTDGEAGDELKTFSVNYVSNTKLNSVPVIAYKEVTTGADP